MKLQAIGEFVIVEPEAPKTETKSGIVLVDPKFSGTPKVGRIISIGAGVKEFEFKEGDRVAISVELGDVHGGIIDEQRILRLRADQIVGQVQEGVEIE